MPRARWTGDRSGGRREVRSNSDFESFAISPFVVTPNFHLPICHEPVCHEPMNPKATNPRKSEPMKAMRDLQRMAHHVALGSPARRNAAMYGR